MQHLDTCDTIYNNSDSARQSPFTILPPFIVCTANALIYSSRVMQFSLGQQQNVLVIKA